jgi:hypothetical protein
MPKVKHVHSSGRYDRPGKAIRAALDTHVERDEVEVLTLTEHNNAVHRRVLAEWALTHRFEVAQGPGDAANCALAVGPGFRVEKFWAHQLTDQEQRRGPGGPPPPESITALVEHVATGERSLWSVAHLPSHVEGDWNVAGPFGGRAWRVWLWLKAVREWKRHTRALRRRYGVKAAMVADWNLDFRHARFRALVKALFPRLRLTWRRFPAPGEGTHDGGRVIDATLTNMRAPEPAALLPDDESSDHRPYAEELAY